MRTENKILLLGFGLMAIGIVFAVAYGFSPPPTLDDDWKCGYVNTTAMNLSQIRDCFRD